MKNYNEIVKKQIEANKKIVKKKYKESLRILQFGDYDHMSGIEFESFAKTLLERIGYKNVCQTQASADHGVDLLAEKGKYQYAIQCKRYDGNVGNHAVQEVYSGKVVYSADKAIVITNSHFTKQAISDAEKLKVELWDREKLQQFLSKIKASDEDATIEKRLNKCSYMEKIILSRDIYLESGKVYFIKSGPRPLVKSELNDLISSYRWHRKACLILMLGITPLLFKSVALYFCFLAFLSLRAFLIIDLPEELQYALELSETIKKMK